jgi:uncharacterized membrane protein
MDQEATERRVERWIGRILRFGVWASAGLMVAGLVAAWISDGALRIPKENPPATEVLRQLLAGSLEPTTLIFGGLILLMLTPLLRVLTAAAGFIVAKDHKFTLVSFVIFLMLVGELAYSLR